jgi:hypothetical protein
MKFKNIKLLGAVVAAALLMSITATAATLGVGTLGIPVTPVNSALWPYGTNDNSLATNGYWTGAITNQTIETNLTLLTPVTQSGNLQYGKPISIQITGEGTVNGASNVWFVLTSATAPVTITNNATTGAAGSANPRATYATAWLTLSATANTYTTTNFMLGPSSTVPYGGGMNLYLENISNNMAGGVFTNYSVTVSQQQ